jgi:hypothetical protein
MPTQSNVAMVTGASRGHGRNATLQSRFVSVIGSQQLDAR